MLPRIVAAVEANQTYAAYRAIDDPVKLAKAARIVRLALARGRLTPADILPTRVIVEHRARTVVSPR